MCTRNAMNRPFSYYAGAQDVEGAEERPRERVVGRITWRSVMRGGVMERVGQSKITSGA